MKHLVELNKADSEVRIVLIVASFFFSQGVVWRLFYSFALFSNLDMQAPLIQSIALLCYVYFTVRLTGESERWIIFGIGIIDYLPF